MITDLASRFHNVRVWVAGDLMLDEYITGSATRISPEAPVPVLDVHSRHCVPGGAANVAANAAALGAAVTVTGLAGNDSAGISLRELLKQTGVEIDGIVDSRDRATTCKTRIVAGRQQMVRIDHAVRTSLPANLAEAVVLSAYKCIQEAHVAVISDYAKGLLSAAFCSNIIEECRRRGLPVIVDPKSRDLRKYRGCTVITPNLHEAEHASGIRIDSEAALNEAGEFLMNLLPGTGILITRGAEGMTLFQEGRPSLTVSTVARQVYDVTGAGDTAVAALSLSLGAGLAMPYAMRIANIAAGLVVDKPGTATATVGEILNHDDLIGIAREWTKTSAASTESQSAPN